MSPEAGPRPFPIERQCPYAPPAEYVRMHTVGPVTQVRLPTGKRAWVVTGYDAVRAVLASRDVSADVRLPGFPALVPGEQEVASRTRPFIRMDPPEHSRLRRMVQPLMTARRARLMRRSVQRVVDERIDEMLRHGPPTDLLTQFAQAVSSTVMCELIGVRRRDPWFGRITAAMSAQLVGGEASTVAGALEGLDGLFEVLDELVTARGDALGDDLLSRMVVEQLHPGHAERSEIVTTVAITLIAGRETTTNQIALSVLALLDRPELHQRVLARPELLPGVVDELLRLLSIGDSIPLRVALADIEVGGQVIPAGDGIIPLLASANHDPSVFPDPERVEPGRGPSHVAFGYGVHQCVGHNLARVELEIAIGTLLDRLPGLQADPAAGPITFRQHGISFGPQAVPVTW